MMKGFPKGKGAWMAKVGEKGQIVIPKEARDMFQIAPGDTLLILGDLNRGLAIVSGDRMAKVTQRIFGEVMDDIPEEGDA